MRELELEKHRMEIDQWASPEMAAQRMAHERAMAGLRSRQPVGVDPQQHVQLLTQLAQALQALSAPRRRTLVRGPNGRASHMVEQLELPPPTATRQ